MEDRKFKVKTNDKEVIVTGNIVFKWFPQLAVYFEGRTEALENLNNEKENFSILTEEDEFLGEGFIIREGFEKGEYFIKGIFARDCISGEPTIPVNEVRFVVPNMGNFEGSHVKVDSKGYSGRISFNLPDKEIILDKLPDFKDKIEELKKAGGYYITYSGKIIFKKPRNLKDFKQEQDILNCFLQILNGKQISGVFFTGMHEGKIVWQDFSPQPIEPYNIRGYTCFPYFLEKEDIESLGIVYQNLQAFWKQEDQKTMIKSAVRWYLEANTKPYYQFDTSVIISQSALEMFYNWFLVEKDKILKGNPNLSAANKIRLLLARINVKNNIPKKFTSLEKYLSDPINNNEHDAIDAAVLYRNAIVHGEYEKRVKLQTFTPTFKQNVKDLSIWYLELCILYVLGYNGRYSNRTTAEYVSDFEEVPWQKK